MEYSFETLKTELIQAASQAVDTEVPALLEEANPAFGADLALPCFAMAKTLRQHPSELAEIIARTIMHPALEKTEAAGGFVNIWLNPTFLAHNLYKEFTELNGRYGEHLIGQGKTVVVEFPSPNMAKPFSVGHLRPANQGWALTQLMKAIGYTVITDNHIGDWGTPFGKWVVGFQRYSSDQQLDKDGIYELARVYIKITADIKAEKETGGHQLADEVQQWLLKLEAGDVEAKALAKRFSAISLDHMHKVMKRLKIATDYEYGEAFYIESGKKLVNELVEKGTAIRQDDGSVIVKLDEYNITTPILLEKSNGGALYATSDLATLKFRDETWHPDKVIYVVAAEQQFHFKQLFALADKLGLKHTELVHYWFGLIDQLNEDGTRSKMSSRKGVILLEELLDLAEQKARDHAADPSALTDEAVAQIALGAIKFTDFAQDKKTAILFDWERIFNLQGFSGPYVQYAAVRVGAILEKLGKGEWRSVDYNWQPERELLLQITSYPEVVKLAAKQLEPHRIARYLYDLARILNRYYENTSIAKTDDDDIKALRLWLLGVVRQNFNHGLGLLGIEVPAKM